MCRIVVSLLNKKSTRMIIQLGVGHRVLKLLLHNPYGAEQNNLVILTVTLVHVASLHNADIASLDNECFPFSKLHCDDGNWE